MKKLKAYLFGHEQVGKTELAKKLQNPHYVSQPEQKYLPTKGTLCTYIIFRAKKSQEKIQLEIYDKGGKKRFKTLTNKFSERSDFGIYCIDLSKPINDHQTQEFKEDIKKFLEINPTAQLFLVGTKSDIALSNALEMILEHLAEFKFQAVISTNTAKLDGAKELYGVLYAESKKKLFPNPEEYVAFFDVPNPIQKVRNRSNKDSNLYSTLNQLYETTLDLPFNIIQSLAQKADFLLDDLEDDTIPDKTTSINSFVESSIVLIQGEHYEIRSSIISIAIAAVVTVIAGIIGFGIGFALGLWTGPGAFFSGLAAGYTSAVIVAGEASVLGFCALTYAGFTFFQTTPALESVKEIARQATISIPPVDNFLEMIIQP